MKILITGGTGFLGGPLTQRLIEANHSVRLFSRQRPPTADSKNIEWIEGDLKDPEAVRKAVADVEVIYHLAGLVSFNPEDGPKMYELHVHCTRLLLKEAKEARVKRFILASTSGTIAVSRQDRVFTEDADYPITVVGKWPYYLSKIYEEKLTLAFCRSNDLPLIVLNPSLLLGPGDDRLSSTWIVSKFLKGDLPTVPNGGLSFVDVRDAANAFVEALTRGEVGGRHLLGVNMRLSEFFARLERISQVRGPSLRLPSNLNLIGAKVLQKWAHLRGAEPAMEVASVEIGEHFFYLDASKAERELGFKARDPQETLFDTVKYIQGKNTPVS